MHIPDGFLPAQISIVGYGLTGGITWYSLRQIYKHSNPTENIPKASLLTAAFFIASLIHIPVPPTSIHLILNGLMGIILGYYAFPAILIGLFFQAVLFGHGGIASLGINALIMGLPALFSYHFFRCGLLVSKERTFLKKGFAFLAGASSILISASLFVFISINTIAPDLDQDLEQKAILLSLIGYSFQAIIEGTFTVMVMSFIERVRPSLLPYQQLNSLENSLEIE